MAQTKEQNRAWKEQNKEKVKEYNKKYCKLWREKNAEYIKETAKEYYLEHKEKRSEELKEIRYTQKSKGLCTHGACKNMPTGKQQTCERHWFGRAANQAQKSVSGSKLHWKDIQNLYYEQNKLCAVSKKPISPGDNMQLDHIIPICQGGTNDLSNLRWVWDVINRIKWNNMENRFLEDLHELKNLLINKSKEIAV